MEISIQQLRMLREVARQGTIAKAAERLGYTPSAVSQQLSSAEKATGVAVLERVGRNVALTDAGHELVTHADAVIEQLERAQAAIERVHNEVAGELRIFFFESVGSTMLEPILTRLSESYPELRLRTAFVDDDPAPMVRSGEMDIAFAVERQPDPDRYKGLEHAVVCRDWLKLVVPKGSLDVSGPVELDEVADRNFIAPPPGFACSFAVNQALATMSAPPTVAHRIDAFPTILRLVGAGLAVGLVPDLGLAHPPDNVDVFDLAQPQHRVIELLYRSSSADRPAIQAFLNVVNDITDEMGLDTDRAMRPVNG